MKTALTALLVRELRATTRIGGGALIGLFFFFTLVTLIPFGVGPDLPLLARIGPAMLWLGALLASLLGLDRLLAHDQEDGSLDLLTMSPVPLELALAVKALAHWLATGLPLVAAAPVLGLMLGLDPSAALYVALTLLIGTPALTAIGLFGAALAVSLRRGGLLLAILVLPFTIPVLIFGVAAASPAALAASSSPLQILCGLSLAAMVVSPFAAAMALRQGFD